MIKTPNQAKALIRNIAKENNSDPQLLLRNYMIERFLERIAVSKYKNQFIIKGGILITSMVGVEMRSTMDLDTTVTKLSTEPSAIKKTVEEIANIELGDNVTFNIVDVHEIMEDSEYPCTRFNMRAKFGKIELPVKIDISTGDIITPKETLFEYKLLLEDRTIELLSYTIETVLAEKFEAIITRNVLNTRTRDFYDIYILLDTQAHKISKEIFRDAVKKTSELRETYHNIADKNRYIKLIAKDKNLALS